MGVKAPNERGATPGDVLLDLHRSGHLVDQYPMVQRLVAELKGRELLRAGNLLARLDADELAKEHPGIPTVTVGVTGHGTLPGLVPALTAELARHGILLRAFMGQFDGYVFDLGSVTSDLYTAKPDVVLGVLDPAVLFDELALPWRPEDVERVAEQKIGLLRELAATCGANCRGTLVLNTIPLLRRYTAQLVDYRSRARLSIRWRDFNAELLRLGEEFARVVVLDLDPLVAEGAAASDVRLSVYAKAHLSADLLAAYAREVGHLVRHLVGHTKKCLVLDLDNTVWGGVLGDDGIAGIEVGGDHHGAAFQEFQRAIKQIGSQGPLLTVVSKNEQEPVRRVLREHPEMVLREEDFAYIIANWHPKPENITELTQELNLEMQNVVFADDSAFECWLMRQEHSKVVPVCLDGDPALHIEKLLADGWFDVWEMTGEDRNRTVMYRDELARKDFLRSFNSIEKYLGELNISVRLADVGEADVARVSQLTMRTNQFNLITRRLGVSDVREMLKNPRVRMLAIWSSDRFGDNGLVGVVFMRWVDDVMYIDNFLLSCRVFSRGIEQACLASVLQHARASRARAVYGGYRSTPRNGGVAEFYPRNNFVPVTGEQIDDENDEATSSGRSGGDITVWFRHDLTEIFSPPQHIRLKEDLEGIAP